MKSNIYKEKWKEAARKSQKEVPVSRGPPNANETKTELRATSRKKPASKHQRMRQAEGTLQERSTPSRSGRAPS